MKGIVTIYALSAVLLFGCAGKEVKPFQHGTEISGITIDEKRIWHVSKRFDTSIRNQGSIYRDPEATQYLQSIMDRLFPEFHGKIRVQIVKTPILNAFALPNGSVYMHLGMLARMDNEAQLATVLAHEGAHFVLKHGYFARENAQTMSVIAMGIAIAGVPILPDLLLASSISGFSQDNERAADKMAFERIRSLGYDTRQGARFFEHLIAETKALDIDEPYFFSSHPKLQDRIDSFELLHKELGVTNGTVNEQQYMDRTHKIRLDCMQADLSMDRYKSMILVLEDESAEKKFGAHGAYFLGEAYRRRGKDGDYDKAATAYQKAITSLPEYAPSYKALGLYHMKNSQYAEAKTNFNKYLELADGKNTGYVKSYLKQIEQKGM